MSTYRDLKSVQFLEPILAYAGRLLNVEFQPIGRMRFRSACPFHADAKKSFRVFVDGENEVRFHCLGDCNRGWDIYDLIMRQERCGFIEAQQRFADFLGVRDYIPLPERPLAAEKDGRAV